MTGVNMAIGQWRQCGERGRNNDGFKNPIDNKSEHSDQVSRKADSSDTRSIPVSDFAGVAIAFAGEAVAVLCDPIVCFLESPVEAWDEVEAGRDSVAGDSLCDFVRGIGAYMDASV